MTIELFGFPGTRSSRVQWLLEELELPYEFHKLALFEGEHKRPPYTDRHPHGLIPAASDGDMQLIESAAMVLHFADKAGKLAPAIGSDARGRYYQFVIYAVATVDVPTIEYYLHTVAFPEARRDAAKAEAAKPTIATAMAYLERELGDSPYLVGGEFSAADVAVGYDLHLLVGAKRLQSSERLMRYYESLSGRPAFKKVFG